MIRTYSNKMNIMPSYLSQTQTKVLVKPQEKSFDIRKETNTGISYDRPLAICQHTSCPMVLKKQFQVCSRTCNPIEKSILLETAIPNLKCKSSLKVGHFLEMLNSLSLSKILKKLLKVDPELLRTVIFGPILCPIRASFLSTISSWNKDSQKRPLLGN